jgi:hypothetical protein
MLTAGPNKPVFPSLQRYNQWSGVTQIIKIRTLKQKV